MDNSSFVLASTQELHEKISELANRVRELEDALRNSHSQLSHDVHPLLSEELLKIKAPLQREPPAVRNGTTFNAKEEESNPDVVDAFGSLSINLSGKSRYYGHIANSVVGSKSSACHPPSNMSCQYFLQVSYRYSATVLSP